jgi:hypothetical protein
MDEARMSAMEKDLHEMKEDIRHILVCVVGDDYRGGLVKDHQLLKGHVDILQGRVELLETHNDTASTSFRTCKNGIIVGIVVALLTSFLNFVVF